MKHKLDTEIQESDETSRPVCGRKRRRHDPKYVQFDMNLRHVREALLSLGHVVFCDDLTLSVMVEYARPCLPLYARVPDRIGGMLNSFVLPQCRAFRSRDGSNAFVIPESAYREARNPTLRQKFPVIPVGATISCFNPLHPEQRVDAIVVVSNMEALDRYNRCIVGVILPAIVSVSATDPVQWVFGADRTVFFENLDSSNLHVAKGKPTIAELQRKSVRAIRGEWVEMDSLGFHGRSVQTAIDSKSSGWNHPPEEGYYAVHYVNLCVEPWIMAHRGGQFTVSAYQPIVQFGSGFGLGFPNAEQSRTQVHVLHGEIDHDTLENELTFA